MTLAGAVLTPEIIKRLADEFIDGNPRLLAAYETTGSCDTSYEVPGVARMRVNIFKQNAGRAIVLRMFPSEMPTLESLGLAPVFQEIVKERNGIVLVTGATGSGKTTTLAAMLNHLNQTQAIHIFISWKTRSNLFIRRAGLPSASGNSAVTLNLSPKGCVWR